MEYEVATGSLHSLPYDVDFYSQPQYWNADGDILYRVTLWDLYSREGSDFVRLVRSTGHTQVIYSSGNALGFYWNSVQKKLVYVQSEPHTRMQIYTWDALNDKTRLLYTAPKDGWIAEMVMNWAGDKAVFVLQRDLDVGFLFSLWMIDLQTGAKTELIAEQSGYIRSLNWSQDGQWLAYLSVPPKVYGKFTIEFKELSGDKSYSISPNKLGFAPAFIFWSPQTEYMLALSVGSPRGQELYLLRLDELWPDAPFLK